MSFVVAPVGPDWYFRAVLRMQRVKQALGLPTPAIANQGKAVSADVLAAATSTGKPVQTFAQPPKKAGSQTARQRRASEGRTA